MKTNDVLSVGFKKSCDNCHGGYPCPRKSPMFPAGHVKNTCTGDIAGFINCCTNWR